MAVIIAEKACLSLEKPPCKIHRESLFLFLDNSGGEAASLQENFNKKNSSFNTP